jgi:flagellar protein FlaG
MNIQSVNGMAGTPTERHQATPTGAPSAAQLKQQENVTANAVKQAAKAEVATKPGQEQLKDLVQQANDFIKPLNGSLQFSIDQDLGTTIVKVVDTSTQEVIKQFPSEEMLGLAKALSQLKGLLVKQQA